MNEQKIIELGYTSPKLINGVWCALMRMMFTTGLFVGIDEHGVSHRYCYNFFKEASDALAAYENTNEHPPGDWIKRKGQGGDFPNPNRTDI